MGRGKKNGGGILLSGWALYAACLLWAFIYVNIPDFTIVGPFAKHTSEEQKYLFGLRKKYSGTQRTLSIDQGREVISLACDFIAKSKNVYGIYDSEDAKELMFGTACVESGLRPRFQDIGGDAIGMFQVEYNTFRDLWDRAIKNKHPELYTDIKSAFIARPNADISFEQLQQSDILCAIFARMKYAETKEPIPPKHDHMSQAEYYKKNYNTHLGKATPKDFLKRKTDILENGP